MTQQRSILISFAVLVHLLNSFTELKSQNDTVTVLNLQHELVVTTSQQSQQHSDPVMELANTTLNKMDYWVDFIWYHLKPGPDMKAEKSPALVHVYAPVTVITAPVTVQLRIPGRGDDPNNKPAAVVSALNPARAHSDPPLPATTTTTTTTALKEEMAVESSAFTLAAPPGAGVFLVTNTSPRVDLATTASPKSQQSQVHSTEPSPTLSGGPYQRRKLHHREDSGSVLHRMKSQ